MDIQRLIKWQRKLTSFKRTRCKFETASNLGEI